MSIKNVEHKFIVPNSVEIRDYQINLANQAKNENCLIVLPTGLGKTVVALHVMADFLSKGQGGILFLAPTRVLLNQSFFLFDSRSSPVISAISAIVSVFFKNS